MEDIAVLNKPGITTDIDISTNYYGTRFTPKRLHINPFIDNLITEGGANFFQYIKRHGLVNESKMLVLSAKNHFYYDCDDLKGISTLINLKKLNLIAHLDSFINTVCKVVSPKTNFIGCFSDRKSITRDGLCSKMYKKFNNFLDLRIDNDIDNRDVKRLLEKNGFKVIDMTEINGLIYFRAQNIHNIN